MTFAGAHHDNGLCQGRSATAGVPRVVGTIRMALQDRIETKLRYIDAPVLVVRGDHDPLVPQRWAERVCRLLPRGELPVMPGALTPSTTRLRTR